MPFALGLTIRAGKICYEVLNFTICVYEIYIHTRRLSLSLSLSFRRGGGGGASGLEIILAYALSSLELSKGF